MQKNIKHIVISYFFVALIQLPALWQLEHVFDNDHGIIYKQEQQQIQRTSVDCSALHKQLNYVYLFELPIFSIPISDEYITINADFPAIIEQESILHFLLRAPPMV